MSGLKKLSKKVSYYLRHAPWEAGLELDEEGWTSLPHLLEALHMYEAYQGATAEDIAAAMANTDKKRFEINGDRIRALYGHSVEVGAPKRPSPPPDRLYHGAPISVLDAIRSEGLKPMTRQFVHMTTDTKLAMETARRKPGPHKLLFILTEKAVQRGIDFFDVGSTIWIARSVPADCLKVME